MTTINRARFHAFVARTIASLRLMTCAIAREKNANVTLIAAIALLPTMFGLGFCIDYARAEMLQSRINAVADAAALAGTDQVYIAQPAAIAQAASRQIFTSQVTDYADFSYTPATQLVVNVSTAGGLNSGRTVYVGWAGQSANMFSGILGKPSMSISGSSTAYAAQAPYVNFFVVMDKSPSMLLPTTAAGITAVQGATADTCAFACHQQFPGPYIKDVNGKTVFIDKDFYNSSSPNYGFYYLIDSNNLLWTPNGYTIGPVQSITNSSSYSVLTAQVGASTSSTYVVNGFYADGYWLTHNYTKVYPAGSAIDLRVLDETSAAQQLIPYAQNQATTNNVTYQMQMFSFDWTHPGASSPVTQYNSMTNVASMTAASVPNLDSTQDWWYQNAQPTSSTNNNDQGTETNNMFVSMNSVMPTPGSGQTSVAPQEVMLLITDGVSDEFMNGARNSREITPTDIASCTTIKNRGIKIAILYTYYDPATVANNGFAQANVIPFLPNVLPALQSCASTANDGAPLVYTVQSNQSIAAALQALFQLTIANSHLIG